MENKYKNELIIEINQQMLDEYCVEYFKKYKSRRKRPVESPLPLSLNKIINMGRKQYNDTKQKYKEFIVWLCHRQNVNGLEIDDCELHLEFIVKNRAHKDIDNFVGGWKMFCDGMTAKDGAGVIVDDNFFIIHRLSSEIKYEKGIDKTIIHLYHNK